MSDTKYNGWANYQTWAVVLWIDNDQAQADEVQELAREIWAHSLKDKFSTRLQIASRKLAPKLREMLEDGAPELSGVYADLMAVSLGAVDWREVADHYIEAAEDFERNPS